MKRLPTFLLLPALLGVLSFPPAVRAQQAPSPRPPRRPDLLSSPLPSFSLGDIHIRTTDILVAEREEEVAILVRGATRIEGPEWIVMADEAVVTVDRDTRQASPRPEGPRRSFVWPHATSGVATPRGLPDLPAGREEPLFPWDLPGDRVSVRTIYARGHVIFLEGEEVVSEAREMLIDLLEDRALFLDVLVDRPLVLRGRDLSVVLRADELRQASRGLFEARGVATTTCEFGHPHVHLSSRSARVWKQDGWIRVSARGNAAALGGHRVVPLPPLSWAQWQENVFPLRRIRAGSSSRFGAFLFTTWGEEIDDLGRAVHRAIPGLAEHDAHWNWNLDLDLSARRGAGVGPGITYASPGLYEGSIETYWIRDRAEGDFTTPAGTRAFSADPADRGRARTRNRVRLPGGWETLTEVSWASDRNVLQEFFNDEFKEDKAQETFLYGKNVEGRTAWRGLHKPRLLSFNINDPSRVEALPQAGHVSIGLPVARLSWLEAFAPWAGPLRLYLSEASELANLRRRRFPTDPPDPDPRMDRRRALRADVDTELALPFSVGPLRIKPFVENRLSGWDQTLADTQDETGRFLGAGGARITATATGLFDVSVPELGLHGLRHLVTPDVVYRNAYKSSVRSSELIPFDGVEAADEGEALTLAVRNRLQTRQRGGSIRNWLDLDLETVFFPDPTRDHPGQGPWGDLEGDLVFDPGLALGPVREVALLADAKLRFQDTSFPTVNALVRGIPWEGARATAGYRAFRDGAGGRNGAQILGGLAQSFGPRWSLFVSPRYNLDFGRFDEFFVGARRTLHRWILEVAYRVDPGKRDRAILFLLAPDGLFRSLEADILSMERSDYARN